MVANFQSNQGNRKQQLRPLDNEPQHILERELPSSIDAEFEVLGSCLHDEKAFAKVAIGLKPEYFSSRHCRFIFDAMLRLWQAGERIDLTTVGEELKTLPVNPRDPNSKNALDEVGGRPFLLEVQHGAISANNIESKLKILQEKFWKREVIKAGKKIQDCGYDESKTAKQALAFSGQVILGLNAGQQKKDALMNSVMVRRLERLEAVNRGETIPAWPMGIHALDRVTNGLQPGGLYVLMARPRVGKTVVTSNIAHNIASLCAEYELPHHAHVYSYEVGENDYASRMEASRCGVPYVRIAKGDLRTPEERELWAIASGEVACLPMYLFDEEERSVEALYANSVQLAQQNPVSIIVVDHIGWLVKDQRNVRFELSHITKTLKRLAQVLQCPVLAVHQLNRGVEARDDKRPTMSDGREAGAIEEDADGIFCLHRPEAGNPDTELRGIMEIGDPKCRHGQEDVWLQLPCDVAINSLGNRDGDLPPKQMYESLAKYQNFLRQQEKLKAQEQELEDF